MTDLILNGTTTTLNGTYNYGTISITNAGILYVTTYNGTSPTGILILNTTGDVTVDSTSSIIGDARGYRGGAGGTRTQPCSSYAPGYPGEGPGTGVRGTCDSNGGGAGGGGSGYGGAGGPGGGPGVSGGSAYGTQTGSDIAMGSGAGGGGGNMNYGNGSPGNPGGAMLTINSGGNINIHGTVSFNGGIGGNGYSQCAYDSGSGGGGGSGGGILLNSNNSVNLSSAIIRANGGSGGAGGCGNGVAGSSGGGGRIKIFYVSSYTAPATLSVTGYVVGSTYVARKGSWFDTNLLAGD